MAHGVLTGLGEGGDECELAGSRAHVAHDDDADGHTVAALDAHDRLGDGGIEGVGGLCVARVEPGSQLAFLGEGDGAHAGGILGRGPDQGECLEHGVMQVGGDVGALGFAHALRLGLRQVLRGAQPHGNESEEYACHQGGTDEAATQQDHRRVVARGNHDDAEAEQQEAGGNNADETQRSPPVHITALAPHKRDTRDDRDDGPHVSPVQSARRVQDGTHDRRHNQGDADDDHAIARHLGGAFLAQTDEAGTQRSRTILLWGIIGDRHPQPQVDAYAHTEGGEADEHDAHERDRQPKVHG